jgi:hypothetical protein
MGMEWFQITGCFTIGMVHLLGDLMIKMGIMFLLLETIWLRAVSTFRAPRIKIRGVCNVILNQIA